MTIPKAEQFLEQAEMLASKSGRGAPRQVDLRRAVSAAYYALFHFVLQEVADNFTGKKARNTAVHTLFYRSIDHSVLRSVCEEIQKTTSSAKIVAYVPEGGFKRPLKEFASAAVELQEKRMRADYDPAARFRISDAQSAIATAKTAIESFNAADAEQQRTLLALLVCRRR